WTDAIMEDFAWLSLKPDALYIQSEHLPRHQELLHQLISTDKAYVSNEPSRDDSARMVDVVRLRNPGVAITFNDLIRGNVTFDTTELGDFVIARSIDDPLYHFAVVVDDGEAGVTHVLRAEEHISNTPRQILIQEALGIPRPQYGHFPLILAPDHSKLSKRKHGASIENYRNQGFLPEAILNYLALLGWNPGTEQELFSVDELIRTFDLSRIHKSGAVFDIQKLRWFNREYLKRYSDDEFKSYISDVLSESLQQRDIFSDDTIISRLVPMIRERIETLDDLKRMILDGEFDFFFKSPTLDSATIPGKGSDASTARRHLAALHEMLAQTPSEEFASVDSIKNVVWNYANEHGRSSVLWPLRYALTGRERSPDPFTVISLLGKDASLTRIAAALSALENV
ncbi:MAG TPA: glutamate--tRNA ligase, partial [Candidatus Paceibacterota bacterium]|nr:glutamate--tRNA ligase [Candidatus Paceibacterota bacterium]